MKIVNIEAFPIRVKNDFDIGRKADTKNINYNDVKYYYGDQVVTVSGEHFPNNNFDENYRYGNINLSGKAKDFDLNSLNNFIPISIIPFLQIDS